MKKLHYNGTTLTIIKSLGGWVCVDVDIEPDNNTVYFANPDTGKNNEIYTFSVDLMDLEKRFPQVTKMYIGTAVCDMKITNHTFCNVKKVIGSSKRYRLNSNILVDDDVLLNTFYKTSDEVIDLKGIHRINEFSFDGCRSNNIINAESVYWISEDAFTGFLGTTEEINGVYYVGSLAKGINQDAEMVELPSYYPIFSLQEQLEKEGKKRLSLKNVIMHKNVYSKCLNIENIFLAKDFKANLGKSVMLPMSFGGNCKNITVAEEHPKLKSIDGILYTKDGVKLIYCPTAKTGTVVIPEGVKEIAANAFGGTCIDNVVLPTTLESIGNYAFCDSDITDVNLVDISAKIENYAFAGCSNLTSVTIGKNNRFSKKSTFYHCANLHTVIFEEGTTSIPVGLCEDNRELKNVYIPSSVKEFNDKKALVNYEHIHLNSKEIPKNLLVNICAALENKEYLNNYVELHFEDITACVPRNIRRKDLLKLNDEFNSMEIAKASVINHTFEYGSYPNIKMDTALRAYELQGKDDSYIEEYLKLNTPM